MKTILVDDEVWMIRRLSEECAQLEGIEIEGAFRDPLKALEFAKTTRVDFAFLDVEMPKMSGLELAKELRTVYPNIIIIFISAYERYMPQALGDVDADYYLTKPYTQEDLNRVVARAKLLSRRLENRVQIYTFGAFRVFVDHKLVDFKVAKAKEMLALLVDKKGSGLTPAEIFTYLWGDKPFDSAHSASYRRCARALQEALKNVGAEHILKRSEQGWAIDIEAVDCDYYRLLDGDAEAKRNYNGIYLESYSWGEDTIAGLDKLAL